MIRLSLIINFLSNQKLIEAYTREENCVHNKSIENQICCTFATNGASIEVLFSTSKRWDGYTHFLQHEQPYSFLRALFLHIRYETKILLKHLYTTAFESVFCKAIAEAAAVAATLRKIIFSRIRSVWENPKANCSVIRKSI